MPACELRHTRGRLSFQRLQIEPALASDNHVRFLDFHFQADCLCHDVKAGAQLCSAKTHQTKTETAGCARPGNIALINVKITRDDVRQAQ